MTVSALTPPRDRVRAARRDAPRDEARQTHKAAVVPPRLYSRDLQMITARWQQALDATARALDAAGGSLPAADLGKRRSELVRERHQVVETLVRLAALTRAQPLPWLSPVPVTTTMLGLPASARACLFDVEGVLTDSAGLHAWAWGEVFDSFLVHLSEKTGWHFIPFDRVEDYGAYVDGRSRLEGIHLFLDSRGIRLPEGRFDDPAEADTAWGLAKRKGDKLARGLRERGVAALPGALRYLDAAGRAGLKRGVLSASTTTLPMLELSGLARLVEERVDAEAMRAEGLRSRPAPDQLLAACRRLGVRPEETVTITHSTAGVAAGRAAGLTVIGVAYAEHADLLRGFGAERVVSSLAALLDTRLSDEHGSSNSRRP